MKTVELTYDDIHNLACIVARHRPWYRREMNSAYLHTFVLDAIALGRPRDWHQLVLEYPHTPDDGDRTRVAYTRDERAGEADRQTVTSLGKYLTRHFNLPDHTIRDIVARSQPASCKFVHTTAEMLFHLLRGPGSCMAKEWSNPACHPYNVYAPARGWHMAVREDGGNTVGRALCMSNDDGKFFVRSYKKSEGYSHSDEQLEAWLADQGYTKAHSWEGCTLEYIESPYGDDFIAPYLDGGCQRVDVRHSAGERYLVITEGGEFECANTDGTVSGGDECEDCGERIRGDNYWVGYNEDHLVCSGCLDSYITVYGRNSRQYYTEMDNAVYVESQQEYFHRDYLDDNDIVSLQDGEYEHKDNCIYLESREVYVHQKDTDWVSLPDGTCEHIDDVVELHDGGYALPDDAWKCEESGDWYLCDDVDPVEIDGKNYHPDSNAAQEREEQE